jgi:hypothetical protein
MTASEWNVLLKVNAIHNPRDPGKYSMTILQIQCASHAFADVPGLVKPGSDGMDKDAITTFSSNAKPVDLHLLRTFFDIERWLCFSGSRAR